MNQDGRQPPRGEIRGFYFDWKKGKYFAVPPSGILPADHAASAESFRARQEQQEEALDHLKAYHSNIGRIRRAHFRPLQQEMRVREMGLPVSHLEPRRAHYLEHFECVLLHGRNGRVNYRQLYDRERLPAAFPRVSPSENTGSGVFDVSIKHSALLWTSDDYAPSTLLASELDSREKVDDQTDRTWLARPMYVYPGNHHLGSVDIHHETGIVMTTWDDASTGHNVHLTTLEGRCNFEHGTSHQARIEEEARTRDPKYHIAAVAVGKASNKYAFLLGGNGSNITAVDKQSTLSTVQRDHTGSRAYDEVFALEMLEDDPNLFVVGQRSGLFRVFDDREDPTKAAVLRAQHVSSICKIKDMGDKKFVVSGLQHTMSVFDLRYMAKTIGMTRDIDKLPNCPPLAQAGLRQTEEAYAIPVLHMEGHKNKFTRKADVAVDRGTRIIAAAQHDNHFSLVKFFDMTTGKHVGTNMKGLASQNAQVVNQIRWADEGDGGENGLKALWFSKGPMLYACRFGADDMLSDDEDEIVSVAAYRSGGALSLR